MNKMKYLIGLDIGTSSVKGVLMTTKGKVVAKAHESFDYITDETGVVEVEASGFISSNINAIKALAAASKGEEICGICASSASGNLVVVDKSGNAMTAVINWQDKRVGDEAKEILGEMDSFEVYDKIGWPFGYKTFPLAQLCYIKKHKPEILKNCGTVCMSTEYLYYVLTGKWGISNSAGTTFYLIDQQKGKYIPEFLEKLGITESMLPPVMPCGSVLGTITEEASQICGLKAGTPVVLGSFDHPSAARGVGVLNEGQMLLSCGTSWVGFFPVKSREKITAARTLVDPFLSPEGSWATMASVASVSQRISLYVERYIDSSKDKFSVLSGLARKSQPGAGGLTIDPRDEPDDSVILNYSKNHIARAIMEGTVNLLKAKLDMLASHGISASSAVMVGGPSEEPLWIEIIEEMCGIPVRVIHGAVAGAVGAAVIAGIGIGIYKDEYDAKEIILKNI